MPKGQAVALFVLQMCIHVRVNLIASILVLQYVWFKFSHAHWFVYFVCFVMPWRKQLDGRYNKLLVAPSGEHVNPNSLQKQAWCNLQVKL